LETKDTVITIDIKSPPKQNTTKARYITLDLTNDKNLKALQSMEIDVIVHLAALVSGVPSEVLRVNVNGTINLLETLRPRRPKLIIIASTAAQLYRNAQYMPIDEQHPITPVTIYGLSKHLTEEAARFYYRVHAMPITIFRQTNVYGPAPVQKYTVINRFIEDSLKKGEITIFGDGRQVRNFIYIDDLVKYYMEAIHYPSPERLAGQVFNISGPEECQIKPMAEKIASTITSRIERKVKIILGPPSIPPEKDIHIFNISSRKAQLFFNYKPEITLTEGIKRTITKMYKVPKDERDD
jgi:UDP-glucose 4-epimerase